MRRINLQILAIVLAATLIAAATMSRVSAGPKDPSKVAPPDKTTAPAPPQPDEQEPLISKMRVQDFPAARYFYKQTEATLAQMGEIVPAIVGPMMATIGENRVQIAGPMIFVYNGVTGDMNKPFQLEIGFPVAEGTKEIGEYKLRELEPFRCATVLYSGPISLVRKAYEQVFGDLFAAGLQPTGETREMYLYWEAPESMNNVELIMIGVAK